MSNLTVENVYTRQTAKVLTKKHFWKLLGMMLTALAVTYAVMFLCTGLTVPAASAENSALIAVLGLIGVLATELVASGLGLGLTSAMLYICRDGEHPKVSQVFSRMGQCLKAFGLMLWVGLKLLLWMLPAYIAMFFSFGAVIFSTTTTTDLYTGTQSIPLDPDIASLWLMLLPFLIMILMFALVIPAAYRYMLSSYILADKPDTGVFECVRQSKAMMKGHKWQAFKLVVPLFLLIYGGMFVLLFILMLLMALAGESAAATAIIALVAIIALLAFVLYFALRMSLGYCIFYLNRCKEQEAPVGAEPETSPEAAE